MERVLLGDRGLTRQLKVGASRRPEASARGDFREELEELHIRRPAPHHPRDLNDVTCCSGRLLRRSGKHNAS
jgi:hypothetical protein